MNRYLKDYLKLLGVAGLVVALDQWTKWLVRTNLPFQAAWLPSWLIWLSPYAQIVHWANSGAAFGTFQNAGLVFAVLAVNVVELIIYFYASILSMEKFLRFVLGLILGGAVGNLIDRLLFGQVTDFVSIGRFPVFNIADASISIGATILLLSFLFELPEDQESSDFSKFLNRFLEDPSIVLILIKRNFRRLLSYVKLLPSRIIEVYIRHTTPILYYFKSCSAFFVLSGILVFIDQWTKMIVNVNLPIGNNWILLFELLPSLKIVHLENPGIVFGAFQRGDFAIKIFTINMLELNFIYFLLTPLREWRLRIAMCFIFAGALGNLLDRFIKGRVTDFISLGTLPVFNIADLLISIGMVVLLLRVWVKERNDKKNTIEESGTNVESSQ